MNEVGHRRQYVELRGRDPQIKASVWSKTQPASPWVRIGGVDGWEVFEFQVLVELQDGAPRMVGLRIEPTPGERDLDEVTLGSRRMANLPVGQLTRIAAAARAGGPHAFMDPSSTFDRPLVRPRGGSDDFSGQVAEVYTRARAEGSAGQQAVQDFYGVPRQTAEGWIKEARARGVLAPSARMQDLQGGA